MPFGGTLDLDNRWVLFSSLMPWEELEETNAPQFSPTTGPPAKSVRPAKAVFQQTPRGGAGRGDQGGIHDRALAHRDAFLTEVGFHGLKNLFTQSVLLQ